MYAVMGFAAGFLLGAKAGQEGLAEILKAFNAIRTSDEFAAGTETAKALIGQTLKTALEMGTGALTGEVRGIVDRRLRAA